MALTPKQIKIISEYPLNDILDSYRDKLRDANDADDPRQEDIESLLLALIDSTAALDLPAPDGGGSVATSLVSIKQRVRRGLMKPAHFRTLFRRVVDKGTDIDIWEAVFAIIENLCATTTPPSSIPQTFNATPVKSSSGRFADRETRDIIERELFFEIQDCTFRNVGGFWDKFFNRQKWRQDQEAMVNALMAAHNGNRWTGFPATPDEQSVWDWLRLLEQQFLRHAPHKLHTTTSANQFKERRGQMDLFFQKTTTESETAFKHENVLVVGEQKKSYDTSRFKADFLQLTRYVRDIFSHQPTRRFVHAFLLCASTIELWVFDRSGPYSSGPLDIHAEPEKFARALIGYATMDDAAMGLDTFITREDGHRYVTLDEMSGKEKRIKLGEDIARQRAIVCRGTTCFMNPDGHVAKFSWVSDKRKPEKEQLERAKQRGVKGVAKLVAHRQITTIKAIREGLEFSKPHRFRDEASHFEGLPATTASSNTSGCKRKSFSDYTPDATSESKRRRSNSQKSKLATELNNRLSVGKARPSLYTPGNDLWENRVYSCLVVSPAGRVISDFRTIKELLESMRDAIKAHHSLYTTGNILHRDISSNNIIITNPEVADGFKGMLIDLDLAKERDSEPSGARYQTGTMQFMAIEVLRKVDHTYRHDLESFFYVLLWMCARQSWNNGFTGQGKRPKESLLRKWEIGRFEDIAEAKVAHMTENGLERIMGEFPEAFDGTKRMCLRIRTILFGDTARLAFGAPGGNPSELYESIIGAYDKGISEL